MKGLKQSTVATVIVGPVLDSTGAAVTNAVVGDFRLAKNGTVATLSGATVTHDANGYYLIALTTGNTDTTGRLVLTSGNTAHSMASHHWSVLPASVFDAIYTNATNSTGGLATATGTITAFAGAVSTLTAGGVRTELNTELGRIDANIGSRATQTSVDATPAAVWNSLTTATWVTDSFGKHILISSNNNRSVQVTGAGSGHIAADIHALQAGVITSAAFSANWLTAAGLAADAATEIATAVAATQALSRLDSMIESDGAGQFRFDTIALEMAPAGGGGGGTDWTANERTAIRSILGIPTSGTTPTDPSSGILDEIRDKTALITAGGTVNVTTPVTASGQLASPLIIGDDYLNANGRAFSWTVALPSGFVAATATCKFGMRYEDDQGVNSFIQSGTVIDAGSGNVTLRFDVAKAVTELLRPGWYDWSVEIASASGTEITRVKNGKNAEWQEKQT
jgi:carbon monoxide dehydrogenase subunit G